PAEGHGLRGTRPVRGHGPQRPGRAGGQRGDREGPAAGFSAGHASMAVLTRRRLPSGSVLAEGDALQDDSRLPWWVLGRQGSLVIPRLRIGANSAWNGLSVIHPPSQPGFPAPDSGPKKFNSRLVTSTIFPHKPIVGSGGGFFPWNQAILAD